MTEDWDRGMGDELCPHGRIPTAYCHPCEMEKILDLESDYGLQGDKWDDDCVHHNHPNWCIDCLKDENRRMIKAFRSIYSIAGDMLEEERRAGPNGKVRAMPEEGKSETDDVEEGHPKVPLDLSGL